MFNASFILLFILLLWLLGWSYLSLLWNWLRNRCRLNRLFNWLLVRLLLLQRIHLSWLSLRNWCSLIRLLWCWCILLRGLCCYILIWLNLCLICVLNRLCLWNWCILDSLVRTWSNLSWLSLRWVFKSRFFIYFATWSIWIILLLIGCHLFAWHYWFSVIFYCLNFYMLLNCIYRI